MTLRRTVALVVGIERYAAGPAWRLPGPARDALRFRDWLVGRGVPERNVLLHLAPEDGYHVDVEHRPAGQADIRHTLLTELPALAPEVVWIWWGGHGVLDEQENNRLFCADATAADKRNLHLESARATLASDLLPGRTRQLWVVDACRTFVEDHRFRNTLPTETLPSGRRTDAHEQAVLLAATRGRPAVNDPLNRAGLFSDALLRGLAEVPEAGPWPPDAEALYQTTAARLDPLRQRGRTDQLPTLTLHGHRRGVIPVPASAPPTAALGPLIDALLDYPLTADPDERQTMVLSLPPKTVARMRRHPLPRADLVAIVTALRRRPEELWVLYDAVTALDDDEERAVALATAIGEFTGPRP
ncbi:effector-associated domain 2-containing protein [Streptomyces millisiae]|uniref:Caspase family protein n=1 Tax=Streptomyces millisiae TaxID=3075542 RepID=A0ABU2LVT0_9ACTN|nr:caspase family protein [Streptomyces sp. DSM 44918]MDT0321697.1 caspase family protein [Streptomyces sp. DSM 44918]